LAQLDLLITVDTSVAHAAGALGVPTWLLVAMPPDYRWRDEGDSTCWYPCFRIYRQGSDRKWEPVIARLVDDLRQWLSCDDMESRRLLLRAKNREKPSARVPLEGLPDVVETRFGVIQVPPAQDLEFRSLRALGEYASGFRNAVLDVAQTGQTVLQIAAGAGELSLALSWRLGPEGHLLALESDEYTARCLQQNVVGNRASNVTALKYGLDAPAFEGGIDGLLLRTLHGIVVCRDCTFARFDESAGRTIWSMRPWVLALLDSGTQSVEFASALSRFAYRFWTMDVPIFRQDSYLGGRSDGFVGLHKRAILALAEEEPQGPGSPAWKPWPSIASSFGGT
jgi:hypothetical protein